MPRSGTSYKLLYFALVPAIVAAVFLLGGIALRTTLQIEKARQQSVISATLAVASERVDRLDKLVIEQDNVVLAHADLASLKAIGDRWLPTAARETPTVRAILVLDMDNPEHEVAAFASRSPGREDDIFRRVLVGRLFSQMNLTGTTDELRHLHHVLDGQSYLVSYWQRSHLGRRYMIVAWHDVRRIVHDVLPRIYRDIDPGSRMNVIDEEGRIVFGPPIKGGEFTVGRPFPTTLYNWQLQVALTTAEELNQKVENQRFIELAMVTLAGAVALAGLAIVLAGSMKERRLAQLKSDFVANVSHELKTPLALIRMFGEMLLLEKAPTPEKRRQYLQIIMSESERLTALIENVLDFAKVERGKSAYSFEPGDVGEAVARAVEIFAHRAERESMNVSLSISPHLPSAMIDARALELATINLIDNAFKYAKDGGKVEVEVVGKSSQVLIRVRDFGPGIDPDDRERIFERFVRGKNAGEKQVRGSGIGLALVKHIAESHGGEISVHTPDDGKGSLFILALPASTAEPQLRGPVQPAVASGTPQ
ncbi:MAG: HAMP domain-containing histidine kinase [Polyangiaceae bacterium]|nr:HAMP domain-containing histidine kinase [Polyangiaceae bacterium]